MAIQPSRRFRGSRTAGFQLELIGRRVGHEGAGSSPLAMTASYTLSRTKVERQMTDVVKSRLKAILSFG
jgi:hypothetical protein